MTQIAGPRWPESPKVLTVEGVIVRNGQDADGDIFDLDAIRYGQFMASGYLTTVCAARPKLSEIAGHPKAIWIDGDEMKIRGEVIDPDIQVLLEASEENIKRGSAALMGFAMAGIIHEKEGDVIKRLEIRAVAIVLLDKVTDKACVCRVVEPHASPR